jgi:hypothetical protein
MARRRKRTRVNAGSRNLSTTSSGNPMGRRKLCCSTDLTLAAIGSLVWIPRTLFAGWMWEQSPSGANILTAARPQVNAKSFESNIGGCGDASRRASLASLAATWDASNCCWKFASPIRATSRTAEAEYLFTAEVYSLISCSRFPTTAHAVPSGETLAARLSHFDNEMCQGPGT